MINKLFLVLVIHFFVYARDINLNDLVQKATQKNKHLFVFLHRTDCGYCESLKEFTLQNDIINAYIQQNFIYEHINIIEKDTVIYKNFKGNGREFARKIGFDFYPSSLFFNEKKELIYAEIGYRDTKEETNEKRFFKILHFIKSRSYKTMDYGNYHYKIQEELWWLIMERF